MKLQEAEKIVQSYGGALVLGTEGEIARYESWLPQPKETIIKAVKLWLSFLIQNDSLTKQYFDKLVCPVMSLDTFVEDNKAQKINNTVRLYKKKDSSQRPSANDMEELGEFIKLNFGGVAILHDLQDFVEEVGKLDKVDQLFHQRVYTLIGLEYTPEKRKAFYEPF